MKLRNKILLPVILILAIVVTSISGINYIITRETVNDMIDTEMTAAISNVTSAEALMSEIIDLVMDEMDEKNLSLSRALAEIVRQNPNVLETEQMRRMTTLLGVTEVHVTDGDGVLLWGSVPDYFEIDFAAGEQTKPFLQIIEDPSFELAQDPQPNAASGLMFQYTGVARTDAKGIVQVGIEAGILDAMKAAMSVQKTVAETKVGREGYCFIVEDGIVTASADTSQIGSEFAPSSSRKTGSGTWLTLSGGKYYANAREENGKTIYAVIPRSEFYENLNMLAISSVLISAVAIAFMALVVTWVLRRITKPMEDLGLQLSAAAAGDLSVSVVVDTQDEIGQLSLSMSAVLDVFKKLASDINVMSQKMNVEGDIDYKIDDRRYSGDYRKVAVGLNEMIESYVQNIRDICHVLNEFGKGDFHVEYLPLPGKKAASNQAVEELRKNLKDIDWEIRNLSAAAIRGELHARADADKYKGGWAELLNELNTLVQSIADKLNVLIKSQEDKANWYEALLDAVPSPIFSTDAQMNWTFINKACEEMLGKERREAIGRPCSDFGTAICKTESCAIASFRKGVAQTRFSQEDRHYQINVAALIGDNGEPTGFVEAIQDTTDLDEVINNLNELVFNIKLVSDKVTDGARQIAHGSQNLAVGAANQTGSVESLNASIVAVNEKTQTNAESSANASKLSQQAKQNALKGNEQMNQMLSAMEAIKTSSDNISKIIQTIEDIAFQTNVLALNAAVEAARAGEHGKGFAVVAEEVRTLAARSQVAAKETNSLISESIASVENGTTIAVSTADSLSTIVTDFDKVSAIIHDIARASSEQAELIEQISKGIAQIASVTQQNSASSQETAASSQELASQADMLKNMVADF